MKSLKGLSDNNLLNRLNKLVKQEHDLTCEILLHLIEVEDRRIFRSLGYSSMFVYCTDGLGYAESSANRRIYAARAIRKCPEAYEYLHEGSVNLGTLALVWQHLNLELLEEIRGKSYRQVQTIVSRFNPMMKHRDITRPVAIRKPVASERQTTDTELGEKTLRRGGKNPCSVNLSTPEMVMETVKMHQVNCMVEDEVMQMLDRCKELMSGKFPTGIDYNTLMQELAAEWLKKHDPVQRAERREKRATKTSEETPDSGETSRHISPATRDKVYPARGIFIARRALRSNRDGGNCTYVGPDGKRCNSTWDVEIHHDETAYAMGGGHSINNLRLLCAAHNRLVAEQVFGHKHMNKYAKKRE